MYSDSHGLAVTAVAEGAVQALDHAVLGYLTYRADLPERMTLCSQPTQSLGWRTA